MKTQSDTSIFLGVLCKNAHESSPGSGLSWRSMGRCIQCRQETSRKHRRSAQWTKKNLVATQVCPICATPFHGYLEDIFCSRRCYGVSKSQKSEAMLNINAFDNWGPDMAYALGLFHTDGCLHASKSGGWQISFCNTDQATVQWWHNFVGSSNKIFPAQRKPQKIVYATTTNKQPINSRQILYTSSISSRHIGDRLVALGMRPRKSWGALHIPDMPENCYPHYFRGLWDGDGSLSLSKRKAAKGGLYLVASFASNSSEFRFELLGLFNKRGWHTTLSKREVVLNGADAERLCQWMYNNKGPCMQRKQQIWESWQDTRKSFGGLLCEIPSSLDTFPKAAIHLLGRQSDGQISRSFEISRQRVTYIRTKLGVPVYKPRYHSPLVAVLYPDH